MTYHVPIMPAEVIRFLNPSGGGVFVDGTLGGGGHSLKIYTSMPVGSRLIGIDRDGEAITEAYARLTNESKNTNDNKSFTALRGNFFNMKELLSSVAVSAVDGILLDLGVSSHQLDEPTRGFSYMYDAPLDMRMDAQSPLTAFDVVNNYSEDKLREIMFAYGEERYSARIARGIIAARNAMTINTTFELVDVIKRSIPGAARNEKQHPAKRVFQAIRIEVNSELNGLSEAIESAIELLAPTGVIAIITFHSLEDRIVKQTFARLANPCTCDKRAPICTCGKVPTVSIITRKPLTASDEELEANPRARSAKLRACMKLDIKNDRRHNL